MIVVRPMECEILIFIALVYFSAVGQDCFCGLVGSNPFNPLIIVFILFS